MPNRNYINGRDGEYHVRDVLKYLGYTVTRAAASQGVFDVIGLGAAGLHECNVAVQVKKGRKRPSPCEYRSAIETELLDSTHRIVLYLPVGQAAKMPQVLYSSIMPLPEWCIRQGWIYGPPPRQQTMRLR